jgi:hypothetical protein
MYFCTAFWNFAKTCWEFAFWIFTETYFISSYWKNNISTKTNFCLTFGRLRSNNFDLKFHLKFMKIGSIAFLLHFVCLLCIYFLFLCSLLVPTVMEHPNFFIICHIA